MNLQGYINIDIDDSMSNGNAWKNVYGNAKYVDIIKEYLQGSCISSAKISESNYRYINNIYSLHIPPNTLFGLPQIALCPLKNHLFDEPHKYIYEKFLPKNWKRKAFMEKFIFENFNYYMVDSCPIEEIEETIDKLKNDIVQNRQYHLFYLLNTYKDPDFIHWKNVGQEDVDYLFTYNNNTVGCAFETVSFGSLTGGKTSKNRKRKSTTRKLIKIKETTTPFVFTRTSFGMPIMYRKT